MDKDIALALQDFNSTKQEQTLDKPESACSAFSNSSAVVVDTPEVASNIESTGI